MPNYKMHYRQTDREQELERANQENTPNYYQGCYADTHLCGNGAYHAPNTRNKSLVTCSVCLHLLDPVRR